MAVRKVRPTSPGNRGKLVLDYHQITQVGAEKSLTKKIKNSAGRNNSGKVTVRHRGGGVKRKFRLIDFLRKKDSIKAVVKSIEYDPYRSAFISLVQYVDGQKVYVLAPEGIQVGDVLISGKDAEVKVGHSLFLKDIPPGTEIHNVELIPGNGGQLARSAGSFAVLMAKSGRFATVKLPSGEMRLVPLTCRATIGKVSNSDARNTRLGKAGIKRKKGFRPTVRGSVMNACDHPHGGGEGKAPVGRSGPVSPWGKPTLGYKTRKKKKLSDKYIVGKRS